MAKIKDRPQAAQVAVRRLGDEMFLRSQVADGEVGGRRFTVTSNVAGADLFVEFDRVDGDESMLGRDRFVVSTREVVEACVVEAQRSEFEACADCGCTDVEVSAWVRANGGFVVEGEGPLEGAWCPRCESDGHRLVTVKTESPLGES